MASRRRIMTAASAFLAVSGYKHQVSRRCMRTSERLTHAPPRGTRGRTECKGSRYPASAINVIPDQQRHRLLSVRAHDARDTIVDAEVAPGTGLEHHFAVT